MLRDFHSFVTKSNAMALAIGVIIGGAVGNVVSAINADVLMPIIGLILPAGDWRTAQISIGKSAILYGHLLGAMLDFLVIALVVFALARWLLKSEPPAG